MKKLIFAIIAALFFAAEARAQDLNSPATESVRPKDDIYNAEQIIENNKAALVSIWYHTDDYYSPYSYGTSSDTTILNGSGFIISPEGFVGTNFHVVDAIDSILIKTSDGTYYDADLLMVDEKNDLALLKIRNPAGIKFPSVTFGNSDSVKVGQNVFAIGSPLGFEYTISEGIIAAIRNEEKVNFSDPLTYAPIEKIFDRVIQITAAISPGNSGGALFNNRGEVIGITTYSYGFYGNLNFAIAINSFKELEQIGKLSSLENNEDYLEKRNENLFNINLKLAGNYKSKLYYTWAYSKQADTMTKLDTFVVKQDSLNKINFGKAETYYLKSIDLKPDTFFVYSELIDLYIFTENFKKAEDLYLQIKDRFDSDSLLNTLSSTLAGAYSTTKDYEKALMFYKKVYSQDTNDIAIQYQIANTYELMNKSKEAVKEYNKIIKRDSSYTQAYIQLGAIYFEKYRDFGKAKRFLTKAYEKELTSYGYTSYNPSLHYYTGMIAVQEGRKLDAIMSYLELKGIYTYTEEDNKRKLELYKAIQQMDE